MIYRNVLSLLERDAIELVGGKEHAVLENVVDLEVRLDLRLIERVLRLSHLLRIVLIIPRSQLESALLRVDELLHVSNL